MKTRKDCYYKSTIFIEHHIILIIDFMGYKIGMRVLWGSHESSLLASWKLHPNPKFLDCLFWC